MSARRVVCGALLIFGAACKSDQQKAEDARQTIRSWQATMRLTDRASARDEVPQHFRQQLRAVAREAMAQADRQ